MARNARHRIDPKTGEQRPEQQVGELHLIEAFDENGRVGFFCDEGVQFRNPSSVVVQGVSPVDPFTTVIKAYSEISILGEPTDEEYWVDYDQPGFRATTFVNFNPSEVGKYARITYHGLGTAVHPRYFEERTETFRGNGEYTEDLTVQGDTDLQGNVGVGGNLETVGNSTTQGNKRVDGDFSTGGSVSLAEDSLADIQLNAKRAQNASNPVDPQDLATMAYAEARHGVERFASSGSFTVPLGVSSVLVKIAGGGGGGGGGGAGGGAGGNGGNGTGSSFGSLLTVGGGNGGNGGGSGSAYGAAGGAGSGNYGQYGHGGQGNAAGFFLLNGGSGGGSGGGPSGICNVNSGNAKAGVQGGGGGGGANGSGGSPNGASGAGGGSSLEVATIAVTSGDVISITIGSGGTAGTAASGAGAGAAGGDGYCEVYW